jgi:uncharacterized lipoprotein YehR (DUF1307 family)
MSTEAESQRQPISSFDLGRERAPLVFYDWGDIAAWANRECEEWKWLAPIRDEVGKYSSNSHTHQNVRVSASIILSTTQALADHARNGQSQIAGFNAAVNTWIKRGIPSSIDPLCQALRAYAQRDPALAVLAAGTLVLADISRDHNDPILPRAAALAQILAMGINGCAIDASVKSYATALSGLDEKISELSKTNLNIREMGNRICADQQASLVKLHEEHSAAFLKIQEDAVKRLKEVERTFNDKTAVHSSIDYWNEKAKEHGVRSFWYGFSSIVCGLLGFGGLAWAGYYFFITTAEQAAAQGRPAVAPTASVGEIAVFLILATGVVWLVRILVRILLGELHQKMSASERAVMIRAYLSLLREKDTTPIKDADRAVILGVLFKPSATGMVKEDGLPHPILSMLTNPKA